MSTTSIAYHNEIASGYDESYRAPFWKIYNAITWDYIESLLPEEKDDSLILDAGGGTGLWAIKIAESGYRVILTDIAERMLDVARRKIGDRGLTDSVTVQTSDITDMSQFDDECFALSLAEGDAVSYCDNPEKAIAELARVTESGGHVTVSVDNKLNWVAAYLRQGKIKMAEELLATGKTPIRIKTKAGFDSFPGTMFTIEELKELFRMNDLEPLKAVGKPVLTTFNECLDDPEIFRRFVELELVWSTDPWLAGRGGHIALIGRKI